MNQLLGWLLGLGEVDSVDDIQPTFAEPWAHAAPVLVAVVAVLLVALSIVFYLKFQRRGTTTARTCLGVTRGLLLALLFVTLADPVLKMTVTNRPTPVIKLVFDGTASMAMADNLKPDERAKLDQAVGRTGGEENEKPTRLDYVKAWLTRQGDDNTLAKLLEEKKVRLETFVFSGQTTSQLQKLPLSGEGEEELDPDFLASGLRATGQVTELSTVFDSLRRDYVGTHDGAVILVSDFADTSRIASVGSGGGVASPAEKLGVPVYTVGVGATKATDASVELSAPPKMTQGERTAVSVKVAQTGLSGQRVTVKVEAKEVNSEKLGDSLNTRLVGRQTVTLDAGQKILDFPYTPRDAGRFDFVASIEDEIPGDDVTKNNSSSVRVRVIDNFMRLLYVAFEPTWEWRFIKEVFHRDKLVGMRGFRTYLLSADKKVRERNPLFLVPSQVTQSRDEFFAHDVIFIGDMPGSWYARNTRFCNMTKEFVSEFGGGLVVIVGPRFGGRALARSPLSDMLPVVLEPGVGIREYEDPLGGFRLQRTPLAQSVDFMQLGGAKNPRENEIAWRNLGKLQWYQPVQRVHSRGLVLAQHPVHKCADGKTPQPLIAIRRYGKGEVIYIGFDELWRLRREYGETYYRQFWSQMINRLSLSHALGREKRFVLRTDLKSYKQQDQVRILVDAYNKDFKPINRPDEDAPAATNLPKHATLSGTLVRPGEGDAGRSEEKITLTYLGESGSRFEARILADRQGEYVVRVNDPITHEDVAIRFQVAARSAEQRQATRDTYLQTKIAGDTGGKAYDLTNVSAIVGDLNLEPKVETYPRNHALWSTPLWFIAVVLLMVGEWFSRKMINLS